MNWHFTTTLGLRLVLLLLLSIVCRLCRLSSLRKDQYYRLWYSNYRLWKCCSAGYQSLVILKGHVKLVNNNYSKGVLFIILANRNCSIISFSSLNVLIEKNKCSAAFFFAIMLLSSAQILIIKWTIEILFSFQVDVE